MIQNTRHKEKNLEKGWMGWGINLHFTDQQSMSE